MTALKKAVAVFSAAAMCTCGTLLHTSAAFRGDVNDDGRIDSFDVVKCRKALLNSFSGGREAIYVELTRPEMCGYVGSISESEFGEKAKSNPPYVLLISSAKYDGTVGQHPESYHKALDSKGVEHIWHEIPDGGHGETFIRLHMYNFLKYIFKAK